MYIIKLNTDENILLERNKVIYITRKRNRYKITYTKDNFYLVECGGFDFLKKKMIWKYCFHCDEIIVNNKRIIIREQIRNNLEKYFNRYREV